MSSLWAARFVRSVGFNPRDPHHSRGLKPTQRLFFLAFVSLNAGSLAADLKPLRVSVNNGPVLRELPIIRMELPAEWRLRTFDVVELRGAPSTCAVQRDGDVAFWRAGKPIG